jgi:hypothetical protein
MSTQSLIPATSDLTGRCPDTQRSFTFNRVKIEPGCMFEWTLSSSGSEYEIFEMAISQCTRKLRGVFEKTRAQKT